MLLRHTPKNEHLRHKSQTCETCVWQLRTRPPVCATNFSQIYVPSGAEHKKKGDVCKFAWVRIKNCWSAVDMNGFKNKAYIMMPTVPLVNNQKLENIVKQKEKLCERKKENKKRESESFAQNSMTMYPLKNLREFSEKERKTHPFRNSHKASAQAIWLSMCFHPPPKSDVQTFCCKYPWNVKSV